MSFIYAEKTVIKLGDQEYPSLHVMGDTKFTPVPQTPGILNWGEKTFSYVSRYGLVKSMIVRPKCCISFAGNNIAHAHDLLSFLHEHSSLSEEQLLMKAFEIHLAAPKDAIEFLICTVDECEAGHITCIKDREVKENCPQAWIGSAKTYEALQARRNFSIPKAEQAFSTADFQKAIEHGKDDSVGGFITNIYYDSCAGCFSYSGGMESSVEIKQTIQPGEIVRLYDDAANGGYTVYYYDDPSEYVLSLDQGDLAIVYTNRVKYIEENSINEHTRYFMTPILMRTSTWEPIGDVTKV